MGSEFTIRPFASIAEFEECVRFQEETWGEGFSERVPVAILKVSLRLGGIAIAEAPRLEGHSDGDALVHAIIDALLGAVGEGDIGRHFPPGDPDTAGIDSCELLTRSARLVGARGFRIANIDATVIAERPRLDPHIAAMRESIAIVLAIARAAGIEASLVNVKATTMEQLGPIGAGEALAASAVALLDEQRR